MVAAYLVGTRGTPRHAVALGLTVTVTHTIGVFALGLVTLGLSAWIVPEDLYPWLNLAAGLLVAVVGASVLRARLRARRAHHHHHHHHHPERITWRGLAAMGASAGLVPCPSALVVLLAAIAQHQVALGLVLIVAFSAGLAATLTALGLAVVYSGRALGRLPGWVPASRARRAADGVGAGDRRGRLPAHPPCPFGHRVTRCGDPVAPQERSGRRTSPCGSGTTRKARHDRLPTTRVRSPLRA